MRKTCMSTLPFSRLQDAVNEANAMSQAPLGMCMMSALSAISTACQGLIDVRLPGAGVVPCSLMTLVVAKSGERKSSVDKLLFEGVVRFSGDANRQFDDALALWQGKLTIWEVKTKELKSRLAKLSRKQVDTSECEAALEACLASRPVKPKRLKLIYMDATVPALVAGLAEGSRNVVFHSTEGAAVLGNQALSNLSLLNACWSGEPHSADRATKPSYSIEGCRITIAIMLQPDLLTAVLEKGKGKHRASGLLSRFLVIFPESTQGERFLGGLTRSVQHLTVFNDRIEELLKQTYTKHVSGDIARDIIEFSPEAKDVWLDFYNWVEKQIRRGGCFEHAGDHASKLPENVARLAAMVHLFEGYTGEISAATVRACEDVCMEMSDHFMRHFVPPPEDDVNASLLNDFLRDYLHKERDNIVPVNWLRQYGPYKVRDKAKLDRALAILYRQRRISFREGRAGKRLVHIDFLN